MNLLALRYKRFHSSYVIGWICLGLLVGIGLGRVVHLPFSWWLVGGSLVVLVAACLRPRWYMILLACMMAVLVGNIRGSVYDTQLESLRSLVGQKVVISGVINEDPQLSVRGDTRLVVSSLRDSRRSYAGVMWVSINGESTLKRGGW